MPRHKPRPRLPPGQREWKEFPRFGMPSSASYRPDALTGLRLEIGGEVDPPLLIKAYELERLPRVEEVFDFHCVTTWSYREIRWGGYRFADFFEEFIRPSVSDVAVPRWLAFTGGDGFRASLLLEDALHPSNLLADEMDGVSLTFEHGAPIRLIAPRHYGYKSVKHLARISLWSSFRPGPGLLEHPRARVELEERGRRLPPWLLRRLYRPLVSPIIRRLR